MNDLGNRFYPIITIFMMPFFWETCILPPPHPIFHVTGEYNTVQRTYLGEERTENVGMVSIFSFPSHTQHYKCLLFYMNINRRMKRIPHLSIFSTGITCVKTLMVKQLPSDFNHPNGSEERKTVQWPVTIRKSHFGAKS